MNIKTMVDRFLGWRLPKDFAPDGGISFKESAWWPTGTNLLHAGQAKEMFEYVTAATSEMDFGQAIEALKAGKKVARLGWNGKGMFLYYVPADRYPARTQSAKGYFGEDALVPYHAYIAMKTADDMVVPWLASQTDMLAEDWEVVP